MKHLKRNYVIFILSSTGAFALFSGVVIAWPAIYYITSRMVGVA